MTTNNMKIKIEDKQYTFRFNADKLRFECNYGYKDNHGIRQSRRLTGRSVDELTENLKAFIKQVGNNSICVKTITLENFFSFYINNIAIAINNHRTIENKKRVFSLLPDNIKSTQLQAITVTMLQVMYKDLYERYSRNTVAYMSQLMSVILNQAITHNIITENVNAKCAVKSYHNGEKKYISPDEIKLILNYVKTHVKFRHLYAPLLLLAFTGCRIGECLGLRKQSLNEQENIVKIEAQVTNGEFDETLKTEKSNREVKVPEFVMKELIHDSKISDTEFVFSTYNTTYKRKYSNLTYSYFNNHMKKVYSACNLEYRSFKQFRNSFAKTAILNGVPLKVVQNILGHSRISTTADIYGELESKDTFFVADTLTQAYSE